MDIFSTTRWIASVSLIWLIGNGLTFTWTYEDSRIADADIVFKANESSVVQTPVSDPVEELTVCFWLRLDSLPWPVGKLVFYNYSTYEKQDEIIIEYQNAVQFVVGGKIILTSNSFPRLDDGNWKFICVQWENKNGKTQLYINGNTAVTESNKQKNYMLAQGDVRLELGYSSAKDLSGRMTCVNFWDAFLPTETILRLYHAQDCGNHMEDLITDWQEICTNLRDIGSPLLVTPSELENDQVTTTTTCTKPELLHGFIFPETALIGHVISTREVLSELQCQDYCLRSQACNAFNVEHQATVMKKTCQLISKVTGEIRNYFSVGRIFNRESMQKALLAPCSETKAKTTPNISR